MNVARHPRSLCKEHALEVLNGIKVELKPYRQPGVEPSPRCFVVDRRKDQSGVSGIGIVAEGVEFTDGTVAMRWITETTTTVLFDNMSDVRIIHGHRGDTVIRWLEDA